MSKSEIFILKDPEHRGLRLRAGMYLDQTNGNKPVDWFDFDLVQAQRKADDIVRFLMENMSAEEKTSLNAAYVAFLRIRGLIQDGEAVQYNLIGQALRWKLRTEYEHHQLTKMEHDS